MSTRDGRSDDTPFALTFLEKKTLAETRSYSKKCGNKIAEEKTNFADKSALGLWWDAKGIFNCSDADEVTAHMERYRKLFKDIDDFIAEVEKGEPENYDRLLKIEKELKKKESEARRDVTNNKSSAVCRMLREFLDKKFNLDHNLKKVECIVLHQRTKEVMQIHENSKKENLKLNDIDKLISEKSSEMEALKETVRKEREEAEKRAEAIRRESEEKLKHVLKEAEEKANDRIREMKEENEQLRLEAEKIRQESDEKLRKAVEEANRRSETRVQAMAEQNRACLQDMMKMLEAMGLPINGATE